MKRSMMWLLPALALVMVGCGNKSDKGDTIKIGSFAALSGDQAVWGQADVNGLKLTAEQINKAGGLLGKKIEIISYDDKGDQLEAVNAVKRLINDDKVVAIIGCNSSGRNIAVAPVADEGKVPVISTFATNPRVTVPEAGKVMKYTFRVCYIDPYAGDVLAKYAYNDLKAKKAAILYEISSDYSVGMRDFFKQSWTKFGGTVVADEAFKTGDVDFRAQLTKIKESKPDVIIMPILYKEVALSAKQARDLGIKATMLGGDGWPSSALLEMAGRRGGRFLLRQPRRRRRAQRPGMAQAVQGLLPEGHRDQLDHGPRRHDDAQGRRREGRQGRAHGHPRRPRGHQGRAGVHRQHQRRSGHPQPDRQGRLDHQHQGQEVRVRETVRAHQVAGARMAAGCARGHRESDGGGPAPPPSGRRSAPRPGRSQP